MPECWCADAYAYAGQKKIITTRLPANSGEPGTFMHLHLLENSKIYSFKNFCCGCDDVL
jgi:hypothetical protein